MKSPTGAASVAQQKVFCSHTWCDRQAIEVTRSKQLFAGIGLVVAILLSHGTSTAAGPAPVDLLSTANFTILSGAAITSTGGGIINGNVGASPITGAAIGVTDAQVNGTIYAVDSAGPAGSVQDPTLLSAAKADLTTAYNDARDRTPVPVGSFLNPGGGNLGGQNLAPGLYKFTGQASITGGDLTLTGGPNDVWIFQIATNLVVGADGRKVILAGGARAKNVFWQVGSSATIGTFAVFKGTIMADQSITMDTSSSLEGRALAFEGGVTWNGTSASLPSFLADLSIEKTASSNVVQSGTQFSYTIAVRNLGSDSATSVVVTDSVPSGITITGSTATAPVSCSETPGSFVCNIGTLASDATVTVTLTALASSTTTGRVDNTATVSSPDPDPAMANNTSTASVTVQSGPVPGGTTVDLSVTKTDAPDPVFVKRNLVYTVAVRNNGPDVATNVLVTDMIPAGVVFVSAVSSGTTCQANQTTVTCLVPAIIPGAQATVTITVVPQQAGTIVNTASAFADQVDLNPNDNSAQASTTVNVLPSQCIDLTGNWNPPAPITCKTKKGKLSCQMRFDFSVINLCTDTRKKNHCFRVAFYVSDDAVFDAADRFIGSKSFYTIKAGATVTRTFKKKVPGDLTITGKYMIAVIDDRNYVPDDIDRNNNIVVFGPIQ